MLKFKLRPAGSWRRFKRETKGVAAIEFAMIAPILFMLFMGSVEFSEGLAVDRRVTMVASATADLVAQSEEIDTAGLDQIMLHAEGLVSSALAANYDASRLTVNLVSVISDDDGNLEVDWSYSNGGGQPYAPGSAPPADFPTALLDQPLTSVIMAEVTYRHLPVVGYYIAGELDLEETFYLRPRRDWKVDRI